VQQADREIYMIDSAQAERNKDEGAPITQKRCSNSNLVARIVGDFYLTKKD
jgi:hypothetical protein